MKREGRLICDLKCGSADAFEELYDKYSDRLYYFALGLTGHNDSRAEEIVQNVFVKIWETRNQIDEDKSFIAYICTIAKNIFLNEYRHQTIVYMHREYMKLYGGDEDGMTERRIDAAFLEERMEELVAQIPPRRKEIYELSRRYYMSNKDIACQLGISESTVESQMNKALAFLRKELSEYLKFIIFIFF